MKQIKKENLIKHKFKITLLIFNKKVKINYNKNNKKLEKYKIN